MKSLVIFFALFFLSTGLFAQKFIREWYIELPGLGTRAAANAIMVTQDGKLFIAGPSNSSTSYGTMFFMKTDTAGEPISTTFSEEQFNDTYQKANHLMEDMDNNYVMIGNYSYYNNTYFTKLSPEGDIISTTVNGGQTGYQAGYDAEQTADGGYLVSSQRDIYGEGVFPALRKLDASGQFTWDTAFTDYNGKFFAMAKINDSDYVFTGHRDYLPGSADDLDILLAKVQLRNDTAFLMKMKIYQQDGTNEQGNDIFVLPAYQGYIICGTGPNPNNSNYTDGIIMRTDTAGNLIWQKTYSRALMSNTEFIKSLPGGDGNILVLARTQAGSSDASLLKYSVDGELLQKRHFDFGLNETAYDFALSQEGKIFVSVGTLYYSENPKALLLKVKDICPVITPEAVLADTTPDMDSDIVVNVSNTNDAWEYSLIQINGNTALETTMGNGGDFDFTVGGLTNDDVAEGLVVSVIEPDVDCIKYSDTLFPQFVDGIEDLYQYSLLIAPNPFHDYITISDIKNNKLSKLSVFNLKGQAVLGETALSEHQKINLENLPKGIYVFRVTYKDGATVFRKVLKN